MRGVIEFHGGFWGWYFARTGFAAMTLGPRDRRPRRRLPRVCRDHEHVHVRQVERWGPFFLPAYLLASAWAWQRGRRPYRDNPFEIEAYDDDETEGPTRMSEAVFPFSAIVGQGR